MNNYIKFELFSGLLRISRKGNETAWKAQTGRGGPSPKRVPEVQQLIMSRHIISLQCYID